MDFFWHSCSIVVTWVHARIVLNNRNLWTQEPCGDIWRSYGTTSCYFWRSIILLKAMEPLPDRFPFCPSIGGFATDSTWRPMYSRTRYPDEITSTEWPTLDIKPSNYQFGPDPLPKQGCRFSLHSATYMANERIFVYPQCLGALWACTKHSWIAIVVLIAKRANSSHTLSSNPATWLNISRLCLPLLVNFVCF